jgi:hypothetical protein
VSFRYYLYVSDAKVDMLLSQIDPAVSRRHRTEIGVDLKLLTAKRVGEPAGSDRFARVERVVRHLADHGDVGSIADPGQFFWGLLPMRWGPFPGGPGSSLVFFDGTTVALGGSIGHVLGSVPGAAEHGLTRSLMPSMLDELGMSADLEDEYVTDALNTDPDDRADAAVLATVRQAVAKLRGPAQNLEFVAKRLLHGRDTGAGGWVLLGSPVYVALVD